jgi:uncharacterized protein
MSNDASKPDANTAAAENNSAVVDEQGVADYLRRHPDFFEDKPTLLADLRVPHTVGTAVSLVERQVAVLRENNAGLQEQLESLLGVARENDRLNGLFHKFTLSIIETDSLDALLDLIHKRLRQNFSADLVAVRLLDSVDDEVAMARDEFPIDQDAFCGLFQRLLSAGKPHCGQLGAEQLDVLFGEQAESVASSALLPLGLRGRLGLLAIGSYERDRFHSGIDTAFLQNLSEVVGAAVDRCLAGD